MDKQSPIIIESTKVSSQQKAPTPTSKVDLERIEPQKLEAIQERGSEQVQSGRVYETKKSGFLK
jgi:hypothetical protein